MATVEFVPNQAETEAITAHVLWMTVGLSLRGRLGRHDLGHEPEPRGHHHGRDPGHAEGRRPQPGARLRGRRRTTSQAWYDAEAGKLDPFVLVVEGSLGNEKINGDGYWTGLRRQPGQRPADHRSTSGSTASRPKAAAVVAVGTCATYGGIPAMKNNPTGAMGVARLPRLELEVQGRHPDREHPRLPGAAGQHDRDAHAPRLRAGRAWRPVPELDEAGRPVTLFGRTTHESCNRAGVLRAGQLRHRVRRRPPLPGQARLQGPGRQVQRAAARLVRRHRRLPERGRHLHGVHDAGLPRQVHAVHGRGPDGARLVGRRRSSPTARSCAGSGTRNVKRKYDKEPEWRHNRAELTTGYAKRW